MLTSTKKHDSLDKVTTYFSKGITPKYVEISTICVVNQACVQWKGLNLGNIKYHSEEVPVKKPLLENMDVLLNVTGTGTLGRVCVFKKPNDGNRYVSDGHVAVIKPDLGVILPEVLVQYFSMQETQKEIYRQYVTGSTNQVDIVFSAIKKMPIPLPKLDEQKQFVELLNQADKSGFVASNRGLSRCLVMCRPVLWQILLNGLALENGEMKIRMEME